MVLYMADVSCRNMMFCALTNHLIKKSKASVEEHLRGKKFAKAKGMWIVTMSSGKRLDDATHVNHLSDLIKIMLIIPFTRLTVSLCVLL